MRMLLFMILLWASTASHARSLFTFSNEPGPYGVGVRYVKQVDPTRSFSPRRGMLARMLGKGESRPRPMQTVVWYPAEKGGRPVRYDDYLQLVGWETDVNASPRQQARTVDAWLQMVTDGKRAAQVEAERHKPMWAVLDAVPKADKFPVVIYAPSVNNTSFENADIAEFLASDGQIVIAAPTVTLEGRWIKLDLMHAELQAGDIRFLIDYARTLPQADMARVAVAGFSWGGLSNILAAAKDARIKALVCLDGAVRLNDVAEYKEYTPEEVSFAYSLGARYVLNFLKGYLKEDPAGRAYLTRRPVANGAPPHALTMQYMPAKAGR